MIVCMLLLIYISPSLLDNQVFYPVLTVDAFSFLNDTDGDNRSPTQEIQQELK